MARFVVLMWLGLATTTIAAQQVMEIIPLQHRLVNDVLPTLQQLVSPGGTVTGMNDQLIIRTDPDNMADLKNVLATLDRRLRQLRISVRQDVSAEADFREDEINARFGSGDFSGSIGSAQGGRRGAPGASVGIGDGRNRIDYHNFSTRREDDNNLAHFVTTVEGRPAFINAGQVVPLANRSVLATPYGGVVQDTIQYRDVGAGFYVTPRLVGDGGVNLEISPYAEALDRSGSGVINTRGVNTVVNGRIGEWIPLGGASDSSRNNTSGIAWRSRGSGKDAYDVWVKVEVVP